MSTRIKESPLNAYDAIAPFYDRLARLVFGRSIVQAQIAYLDVIPANSKVLILGGGTGWLLEELLKRENQCHYFYLDASAEMIYRTRKRVGENPQVTYLHGRLDSIPGDVIFDITIANFFFDQFDTGDVRSILYGLKNSLTREGKILITEFQATKWWHKAMLLTMYRFFSSIRAVVNRSLPHWKLCFQEEGFQITQEKRFFGDFILSVVYRIK
jgi:tRNA (cmo5U34)-methyltransferase